MGVMGEAGNASGPGLSRLVFERNQEQPTAKPTNHSWLQTTLQQCNGRTSNWSFYS